MDVERHENDWLVLLSWKERVDIYAAGEHPSEWALAAVTSRTAADGDELHLIPFDDIVEREVERFDPSRRWSETAYLGRSTVNV